MSRVIGPSGGNLTGNVHGGAVPRLVDELAGVVAARYAEQSAATACMDEMAFLAAVRFDEVVRAHAQVSWTGTTSMEVGVRVAADRWNASVPATHVASAYLVMVATGYDGRPRPMPPVLPGDTCPRVRRPASAAYA